MDVMHIYINEKENRNKSLRFFTKPVYLTINTLNMVICYSFLAHLFFEEKKVGVL